MGNVEWCQPLLAKLYITLYNYIYKIEKYILCVLNSLFCCFHVCDLHLLFHSFFSFFPQAVYGIVQYVLPLETEVVEDLALQHQLKRICLSLQRAVVSNKLPSDCSLIVSTSLCISSAMLCTGNMEINFLKLINGVIQAQTRKGNCEDSDWSCPEIEIEEVAEFCREVTPSLPIVLMFHGLFNSNAAWLYSSQERGSDSETNIPFLYKVHPVIMKMCKSAASYTFQAFQVSYDRGAV